MRGRGGGVRLARPPEEINLAEIVCGTEPGTALVRCEGCGLLAGGCRLPSIFGEGLAAFVEVLRKYSLAQLMARGYQRAPGPPIT